MGIIKDRIDSLKNKYQIHNLENDTYRIIKELEHLDDLGKIKSLEELNSIYKKIEQLLMLEARKHERKAQNTIDRAKTINDRAFERLGIKDNTPSFRDAVRQAGGNTQNQGINPNLSFTEAVRREREKHGIPEPKQNFNPDLSFAEAVEEAKRTHK